MTPIQHPVHTVSYNGILYRVLRRTFEAAKYPKDSIERRELNMDSYTSEYMPSYRYQVRWGSPQTEIRISMSHERSFRTKQEAIDYISILLK